MPYTSRPELYDLEYSFKDYEAEVAMLETIVRERHPHAKTLLDVACGTGKHLEHLRATFTCEGSDIDEGLLRIARERVPDVPLHQADMRDFDLGRTFDVVTCLFSAIGFVGGPAGLEAAANSFARHLDPGGLALVEPWLTPDVWIPNTPHLLTHEEPGLVLARVTLSGLRDERILDDRDALRRRDARRCRALRRAPQPHLFTNNEMRSAFEAAGLTVDYDAAGPTGRGLLICSR